MLVYILWNYNVNLLNINLHQVENLLIELIKRDTENQPLKK